MLDLQIEFLEYTPEAFTNAILPHVAGGAKRLCFRPFNIFAQLIASHLTARFEDLCLQTDEVTAGALAPPGLSVQSSETEADLIVLCDNDAEVLSARLLDYLDHDRTALLAPITRCYHKARPLCLISIPKSGTHLLYEFAQTMGYAHGFTCPLLPEPGVWYFVQGDHSHTRATDFLGETPWSAPFANRHHPFTRTPTLFIYRNPLDILLSEANWYHLDGMNIYAGYFSGLSLEERVLKLIDDPWLLGSIRDRVGAFIAWLEMPNVIPISFEEIVGPKGGGDAVSQLRLIWSLQLKLHVPGSPTHFADTVFNPNSPTFRSGQIGAYRKKLSPQAREKFLCLPQDFMEAYGFDSPDAEDPVAIPRHTERFRKRPLTVSEIDYRDSPVMLEFGFMEHNIVLFQGRVYGLPWSLGPFDMTQASVAQLACQIQAKSVDEVRVQIMAAKRP